LSVEADEGCGWQKYMPVKDTAGKKNPPPLMPEEDFLYH